MKHELDIDLFSSPLPKPKTVSHITEIGKVAVLMLTAWCLFTSIQRFYIGRDNQEALQSLVSDYQISANAMMKVRASTPRGDTQKFARLSAGIERVTQVEACLLHINPYGDINLMPEVRRCEIQRGKQ